MADEFVSPASQRAFDRAHKALVRSGNWDAHDPQTTLADMLADLMTWAFLGELDFEAAYDQAAKHFAKETIAPDDLATS